MDVEQRIFGWQNVSICVKEDFLHSWFYLQSVLMNLQSLISFSLSQNQFLLQYESDEPSFFDLFFFNPDFFIILCLILWCHCHSQFFIRSFIFSLISFFFKVSLMSHHSLRLVWQIHSWISSTLSYCHQFIPQDELSFLDSFSLISSSGLS